MAMYALRRDRRQCGSPVGGNSQRAADLKRSGSGRYRTVSGRWPCRRSGLGFIGIGGAGFGGVPAMSGHGIDENGNPMKRVVTKQFVNKCMPGA